MKDFDRDAALARSWAIALEGRAHSDELVALLRRLADRLEPSANRATPSGRCGRCGGPLPAPKGTGRPRRWCKDGCRWAARHETPHETRAVAGSRP